MTTERKHHEGQKSGATGEDLAELEKKNHEAGEAGNKIVEECLAANKAKADALAQSAYIVSEISETALAMRLDVRNYMVTLDRARWSLAKDRIVRLNKLYGELRKLSVSQEDRQRIDHAEKATQEYYVTAQSWVDDDAKTCAVVMPPLRKAGEAMLATARAAENCNWKAADESEAAVAGIVGASKAIIVVSLIAGMLVGVGLAMFISKSISGAINALIGEAERLTIAAVDGRLAARGNPELVSLEFRPIVEGVNRTLDAVIDPLNVTAEYVDRISKGDIPEKIADNYNGDFNVIKNNLNKCIEVMNGLLRETATLIQATKDGKLQTRGNAAQFAGGWGELVDGVNKLIDAFVAPINVTAECVDRISKGDIPPKITDAYHGDFNAIKNNLNRCIDAVNRLIDEAKTLSKAAESGELNVRADESKHQGDYGKIIHGMNATLEGFALPLRDIARTLQRMADKDFTQPVEAEYPGAYGELRDNVNLVVKNINAAVGQISESAAQFNEGSRVIAESSQTLASGDRCRVPASRK